MKNTLESNITILDVRSELAAGIDPFSSIINTLATMPEGNTLKIVNTFEPIPLIRLLKTKGYEHFTEYQPNGIVHTYLKLANTEFGGVESLQGEQCGGCGGGRAASNASNSKELTFEELLKNYSGKIKEVDVREMEMPLPMVSILQELAILPEGNALFVHHNKIPQFLLPELKDRDYKCSIKQIAEGDVKLLICK